MDNMVPFESLYAEPSRNGLTKPKAVRGSGIKIINMGELFAYPRILNIPADKAPLTPKEQTAYLLKSGDLLFARQSLVPAGAGKCSIFLADKEAVTFESHIIRARLDPDKADPAFYYYYFRSPVGRAVMESIVEQGAGVAGIRASDLSRLEVDYLPVTDQKNIADILGSLDDKIELNRKMNETLEAMARAIFKSWFVDFDPVYAKSKGRQPDGMDGKTAKLFPSSFVDSEIGRVPNGWKICNIGDCVTVVGGSTPSTGNPSFWNGTHCFCTPKDLSGLPSPVLLDTDRKITDEGINQISSGLLATGTVLLSSRAPIGYLVVTEVPTAINQGFIAMVCDKVLPNFYVLRWAEANMDLIKGRANGTTFMEVSKSAFRPIRIIVPSPETLTAFNKMVEPLHTRVVSNLKENACLANIRDMLLPRLLSGELVVPTSKIAK